LQSEDGLTLTRIAASYATARSKQDITFVLPAHSHRKSGTAGWHLGKTLETYSQPFRPMPTPQLTGGRRPCPQSLKRGDGNSMEWPYILWRIFGRSAIGEFFTTITPQLFR